jgi:hypothetical protein
VQSLSGIQDGQTQQEGENIEVEEQNKNANYRVVTTNKEFMKDQKRKWSAEADIGVHWTNREAYKGMGKSYNYMIQMTEPDSDDPDKVGVIVGTQEVDEEERLLRLPRWRVSYIKDTGEIYALEQGVFAKEFGDRVEILGVLPPDKGERWHKTLDEDILTNWADWDGDGNQRDVQWVRDRLKESDKVSIAISINR